MFPPTGRITVDVATVMDAAKHTAVVDASLEKEHFPSSLPRRLDVVFFSSSSLLFCVDTLCDFIEKDDFLVLLHILLLLLLWWCWCCRRSSTRAKSVVVVVIPIVRQRMIRRVGYFTTLSMEDFFYQVKFLSECLPGTT